MNGTWPAPKETPIRNRKKNPTGWANGSTARRPVPSSRAPAAINELAAEHRLGKLGELVQAGLIDVAVQAVAVRIHCADRGKAVHPQVPHRLGDAELLQK